MMINLNYFLIVLFFTIFFSCNGTVNHGDITTVVADIDELNNKIDTLFYKYVTVDRGLVDYNGIWDDKIFSEVVNTISHFDMSVLTKASDSLAFWINAYNIMVINTIREWGIKTPQDSIGFPLFRKKINIAGEYISLDELEKTSNKYIKKINEPRTHFALVCAAMGCPPLLNRAYRADSLYVLLDKRTESFFNDTIFNKIDSSGVSLSPLLSWYKDDFLGKIRDTNVATLLTDLPNSSEKDFVGGYLNSLEKKKILENLPIEFKSYNWEINKQ